jgi:hypothetical protein
LYGLYNHRLGASLHVAELGSIAMDFIEKTFGLSPDHGSGAFEIFLIALPIVLVASVLYERSRRRRPPH